MKKFYVLLFMFQCAFSQTAFQTVFQENATALGLNYSYGAGFLGGGVSFFDYNNDGWDDLTFSSQNGSPVFFFRNNGGFFSQDTFNIFTSTFQHKQVQWVDYDNDNDYDLFVTSDSHTNRLYRNDGAFNFTDVTFTAGLLNAANYNFGASWGDYNNDGYLDIFISFREPTQTQPNLLYRNNGDGTFTEVGAAAGIVQSGDLSFCSAFFDYDNDGWQDIYIANDKIGTRNYMYHNNGDGTFTDTSAATGTDLYMGAMCVTVGDYNNDGWQDLYITNDDNTDPSATQGNVLLHNNGNGTFTNVAPSKGLTVDSVCWGAVFLDANLDTDLDILTVASRDGVFTPSSAYFESTGNGNFFEPTTSGIYGIDNSISYANAIGDVDNDGYPDVIVLNESNQNVDLWQNNTANSNNWLKIKLKGTVSNSDGIGSRIEVHANGKSQYRYTHCGESYLGQSSASEFVGVGTAPQIDYIQVTWLSGLVDRIDNVLPNQAITIIEGSSPLSIDDVNTNDDYLTVFPNPSTNYFKIAFNDNFLVSENTPAKLKLYDSLGKLVLDEIISTSNYTINTENLATGHYTLKVMANNLVSVKQLIIN